MADETLLEMSGIRTANDFLVKCFTETPEVRNLALTIDPERRITRTECDEILGITGEAPNTEFHAIKDAVYLLRARAQESSDG